MGKFAYDKDTITREFLQSSYDKGVTRAELGRKLGLSAKVLTRIEGELGVTLPKRTGRKKFYDVSPAFLESHKEQFNRFLELHNQGLTFTEIAKACGCSQSQVGKLFSVYGYKFDTAYKTKAAHDAVRGQKRTIEDLEKRALSREKTPPQMSRWESWFAEWLTSQGIEFTFNKAFGKYNFDFAIGDSVAVELYGGGFHADGRAAARLNDRMTYLLNRGWNVYIIWCLSYEKAVFPGCLDDFLAFLKHTGRDETFRGKYRVIWSDGDPVSFGGYESDYRAVVFPARMRHNALSKYRSPRD